MLLVALFETKVCGLHAQSLKLGQVCKGLLQGLEGQLVLALPCLLSHSCKRLFQAEVLWTHNRKLAMHATCLEHDSNSNRLA